MTYNQIVEYLNDLDIYCNDNNHRFYDLKNYFKGLNEDLSQQDRQDIKSVIDATKSLPNDKAAETIAAVLDAKNNDTNEALEDDEEYDKEFFKGNDGCYYKKLNCKTVTDYDGFNTDYCLYMKVCPNEDGTNTVSFITIFGDSDLYTPDNSDVDFETNNVQEAFEWFDSYNGFDDDIDESLKEASYGGAYDIEDDMFFTKEELVEFGYDLVDKFSEWADCKADLQDVYMTSPTNLVIEVLENDDISHQAKVKIDMRKIRSPKDIYKYSTAILNQWKDSYNDCHEYEESYSLKEYKDDYIAIANKTSRTSGASALNKDGTIRSVVGRYVLSNIDKDASILDFGAGKDAVQTQALKANGFKNVTAYDFGVNSKDGIHDPNALSKSYDVVFASNVLNVSSDQEMLEETIYDIWNACKNGGTIIFNYPGSPRKAGFKADEVADIITSVTGQVPEVVVGPKSTPVWKLIKGAGSKLKEYYDKDKLKLPFRVIVDGTEYTLNFDEVDFILDNLNKVGISINDISEYEVLDSDKEDEFIVTLKNGEKKKFNESVELKESKCHLKKYNKIKNESVTSRDEIPYTYEEMEADLEAGTHSWKKDNFECWVKYKKEFDDAMDILSKHYENVEDFGYDEGYYGLYATKPSIYESSNSRHFSRSSKLLESVGKSLQRSIIKSIDHFIDSDYEYPNDMFLAYSWEDLKDGVSMGLDPEFETSEGILDYFKKLDNIFNGLSSKEKDLKDNLVKCMNDYLYKNGYDDRIE